MLFEHYYGDLRLVTVEGAEILRESFPEFADVLARLRTDGTNACP